MVCFFFCFLKRTIFSGLLHRPEIFSQQLNFRIESDWISSGEWSFSFGYCLFLNDMIICRLKGVQLLSSLIYCCQNGFRAIKPCLFFEYVTLSGLAENARDLTANVFKLWITDLQTLLVVNEVHLECFWICAVGKLV